MYPQPSTGATTVLPLAAYPPPLYQSQVVYTPDQFSANTASAQQVQQYPLTYPVGYPYTYNGTTYQGYWGQPMTTYYVPQSQLSSAATPASTPMIVPSATSTIPHPNSNMTTVSSTKRGSPPNSAHSQYSAAGHAGVPISLSDPSCGATTMYAIPPLYPGMLPYATPPNGVISHQLQHPQNSVINSVVPPSPQYQIEQPSYHQMNRTNSATPQSAPSTPLSLPLPLPHSKNPPLFATPSIVPNGFTQQMGSIPLQNGENIFDRKHMSSNRRTNYVNSSTNRHTTNTTTTTTFVTQNHQALTYNPSKKPFEPAASRTNTIPPKRNDSFKQPSQIVSVTTTPQNTCNITNHSINNQSNNNNVEKIRASRPKPSNLDLRRSNSNRNTPSTNSAESNNSPNSITSNDQPPIYVTRAQGATHLSQIHPQATHIDPCHQQLISAYNPAGMYVKFGQTYFTHVSIEYI